MKMKKRLILPLILVTMLSTIFLVSTSGTAQAQTSARLAITPSDYKYNVNFTSPPSFLSFNVSVVNVTSLATWQATISWDPTVLSYKSSSIPADNIYGNKTAISTSDNSTQGTLIYGSSLLDPTQAVNGNGTLFNLELNVLGAPLPGTSDVAFAGITTDTFLLDGTGVDIPFTHSNSVYSNIYLIGAAVTHAIPGSSRPVTTTSNGTIQPNSGVIDTVGKTISFNVTGNTGDTAFVHIDFPKNVINVTDNDIARWNVTVSGIKAQPQITQNDTDTSMLAYITFGSDVTVRAGGDNIIPELSSMLAILIITSCITLATAKNRIKKKL
jgi:hypothetical protein